MADLYNLELEEDLEGEEDVEVESDQLQLQQDGDDVDDRERVELPTDLEQAERKRRDRGRGYDDGDDGEDDQQQPPTPDAADEDAREEPDRLDLEDVIGGGSGVAGASATAASTPLGTDQQHGGAEIGDVGVLYGRLKTLWTQELDSPELLPYDEGTISSTIEALAEQEQRLDDLQQYGQGSTGNANLDALTESLLRVDMDRVKYVLCNLLRIRLNKIEAHPLYQRNNNLDRMSDNEVEYLKGYGMLLEKHLHRCVLDHFPKDAWKKLDSKEMIDEPDLSTYVFVKTKDNVIIDNGITPDNPDYQQHSKHTCLIVRYNRIRDLFLQDKIELLV